MFSKSVSWNLQRLHGENTRIQARIDMCSNVHVCTGSRVGCLSSCGRRHAYVLVPVASSFPQIWLVTMKGTCMRVCVDMSMCRLASRRQLSQGKYWGILRMCTAKGGTSMRRWVWRKEDVYEGICRGMWAPRAHVYVCMPACVGVWTCLLRVDSHGSVGVPRVLPQPVRHRLPVPRHLGVEKLD